MLAKVQSADQPHATDLKNNNEVLQNKNDAGPMVIGY